MVGKCWGLVVAEAVHELQETGRVDAAHTADTAVLAQADGSKFPFVHEFVETGQADGDHAACFRGSDPFRVRLLT